MKFGSESEPLEEINVYFCRVASILMPLLRAESGYGIKIDAIKENFSIGRTALHPDK